MAYSGKFTPKNPSKYLGDPTNIIFRSLWERKTMEHLDTNPGVIKWASEELFIPYLSPIDNRWHKYYPDFYVETKNVNGLIDNTIIEIKPAKESSPPEKKSKISKRYIREVVTWGINEAKWNAAIEYCNKRGWNFKVLTERELYGITV